MKKSKTTSKKTKMPEMILDCTNCVNPADVQEAYIDAKVREGKTITSEELQFAKDHAAPLIDVYNICEIQLTEKKKAWYKRFWNWLCRK